MQYQIASEIVEKKGIGERLGFIQGRNFNALQERYGASARHKIYVIKCHDFIEAWRLLILKGEARAVYCYRDIRDVVVSTMGQSGTSFKDIIRSSLLKIVLQLDKEWTSLNVNVLVSRYEDIIGHLDKEVSKIAELLGVCLTQEEIEDIAFKYSLPEQRKRVKALVLEKCQNSPFKPFELHSQLHVEHIQNGKAGRWHSELGIFERFIIEKLAYEWLIQRNYLHKTRKLYKRWIDLVYGCFSLYQYLRSVLAKNLVRRFISLDTPCQHKDDSPE